MSRTPCWTGLLGLGLIAASALGAQAGPDSTHWARFRAYRELGGLIDDMRLVPQWLPDGASFWYTQGSPQDREILRVDVATGQASPMFDGPRLRAALTAALRGEPAGRGVPFARFAMVGPDLVQFELEGRRWRLDLTTYRVTPAVEPEAYSDALRLLGSERSRVTPHPFWQESFFGIGELQLMERLSPDGRWFASTRDYNLAVRATVDGRTTMLTSDGTADTRWIVETEQSSPWAPNGQRLFASKVDTRGVTRIPTVQWLKPQEELQEVFSARAGALQPRFAPHVVDISGRAPVALALGETRDTYVVFLGWTPDSRTVMLAKYNRLMNRVDVLAADATTGETRVILTETSRTFLTNQHEVVSGADLPFTMLPDGTGFLWRSERDGWDHLYRYDMSGTLVARLTLGAFPVIEVARIDQRAGWVYYRANGDPARPYDTHLYRVALTGGRSQQLTQRAGVHRVTLSPSGTHFVDSYSTPAELPRTELRRVDGTLVRELRRGDLGRLQALGYTPSREYVVKAADGVTDLWVTMHLPADFDSTRKYPVVEYIYGGPQTLARSLEFEAGAGTGQSAYNRALAQLGFVVVTLDARGTPGRSKAFHDAVFHNWGNYEIADHAGAIRQLGARLPFLDLSRVGIWGRSWGAHFAVRGLAQAGDLYRVASAEFPGFDPGGGDLYEVYLGMPADYPELYDAANVIRLAPKVRGKLLLVSGLNDTGTMRELAKMSDALVQVGFQHELMVYANTAHSPFGRVATYNEDLRTQFLLRHLTP
ncbi:MAG: DPP IV N-terminal domain-containing protein [Gemmatimonas sp.]|uniref:S9 family peptidase n=1 Tax=Gemmatimonas sp. TaxID=1962908 RepID=UPI00391FB2E0